MMGPYSVRAAHQNLPTACYRLAYFLPKGRTSPRVSFNRLLGLVFCADEG